MIIKCNWRREMENYSIDMLSKASNNMYKLSEEIRIYTNLRNTMDKLVKEYNKLKEDIKKNPHNMCYAHGGIAAGIGFIFLPFFISLVWLIVGGLVYCYGVGVGSSSISSFGGSIASGCFFYPVRLVVYPVTGFFVTALASYGIMIMSHYKEKRKHKLEVQISENYAKQVQIQEEIDSMLDHFYSEDSLLPHIPQPYQNEYATKKFGDYFMQGRATSIKEAANLYEEELRYENQQQQLRQINSAIVTNNTLNAVGMAADAVTDILFIASFL